MRSCTGEKDCGCQGCETERELRTQIAQLRTALQGELREDGCIRNCPRTRSSDAPHNLRCTMVNAALRDSA